MEKATNKLKIVRDHLGTIKELEPKVIDYGNSDTAKPKFEYFKMNGWGYKDTKIIFDREKNYGYITGSRYSFSGSILKELRKFAEKEVDFTVSGEPIPCQDQMKADPPYVNENFLAEIEGNYSRLSFDDRERIMHSHGHTLHVIILFYSG